VLMFSNIFSSSEVKSIMLLWRFVTFYQVLIIGSIVFLYAKTRRDIPLDESYMTTTYYPNINEEVE